MLCEHTLTQCAPLLQGTGTLMLKEPTCSLLCVVHLQAWVMGKHESLHMDLV